MEKTIALELRSAKNRRVEASLSSETPVERWEGREVLVHEEDAIDLSRAPLPLITSHDSGRLNIGLVENIRLSGRKLRGTLVFGQREEADQVYQDVRNGILRFLSIGYRVLKTAPAKNGEYRVTRWMPYEISIVSTPADVTVGIGRSYQKNESEKNKMKYTISDIQNELEIIERNFNIPKEERTGNQQIELNKAVGRYDKHAQEVNKDFPLCEDIGIRGVIEHMSQTGAEYRTNPQDNGGDDRTRFQVGNNRNGQRPFNNLGEQLWAVIAAGSPGGQTDQRLFEVRAASGLNEGTLSEGGFLLQNDFSTGLIQGIFDTGKLPGMCNRFTIGAGKNGIKLPAVDETSRADGSRWGGVQLYHVNEADEFTSSKPKFRQLSLELKKLIGLCYLTDELMEDVPAMENYVSQAFTEEFEYKMDDIILNGTGADQGLGIMNSGALVEVAKESGQAADTIIWANIKNMWARMPAKCRRTAVWLINQDAEPQLWGMYQEVGTAGVPVYLPAGGATDSPYSTLFGRPVIPMEQCQTVGDKGDIVLFDPKSYIIADKGAFKKDISVHVRFIYDEQALRFVYRYDSEPILASAITPANSTNTLSPYITLAERAAA